MKKILFTASLIVMLTSCTKSSTIDATNQDAFRNSVNKIKNELSKNDSAEFDSAISYLIGVGIQNVVKSAFSQENFSHEDYFKKFHGKTAKELIVYANKMKTDISFREREKDLEELAKLKNEKEQYIKNKEVLSKLKIINSRLFLHRAGFITYRVIELKIENQTSLAISKIDFHGSLSSEGRSVPWAEDDFNYAIPGGLEPKEIADWQLSPPIGSSLYRTEVPKNSNFSVSILKVYFSDGTEITNTFDSKKEKRLNELEKKAY